MCQGSCRELPLCVLTFTIITTLLHTGNWSGGQARNLIKSHTSSNWQAGTRALVTLAKARVLTNTLDFLECALSLCRAVLQRRARGPTPGLLNHSFQGRAENRRSYQASSMILSKTRVWKPVPRPQYSIGDEALVPSVQNQWYPEGRKGTQGTYWSQSSACHIGVEIRASNS